jgi:hypothetical protein
MAVFRRFVDGAVRPERCVEAYHLHRTRFERIAERKLRNGQLTDDGSLAAICACCATHPSPHSCRSGANSNGRKLKADDH